MKSLIIGRRDFLHLSLLGACFGLSGCQINQNNPILSSYQGVLPKELIKSLPAPWRFRPLRNKPQDLPYSLHSTEDFDLLAIGDGWLQNIDMDNFSSIAVDEAIGPLNKKAKLFLSNFDPEIARKLFPIALSPWVMLFRRGEHWIPKAKETWKVLLEPELKGQLVLPNSPRLIMSLADKMGGLEALRTLRLNAKTFDDRNSLNWLLSGKAQVAVMPLQNCMSSLFKDPRLTVVIPLEGAPLNWTLLLKTNMSRAPFPVSWIKETYEKPLLFKLLQKGLIPPLSYSELFSSLDQLQERRHLSLPFSEIEFNNFWSLPPMDDLKQRILGELWLDSTP